MFRLIFTYLFTKRCIFNINYSINVYLTNRGVEGYSFDESNECSSNDSMPIEY